MNKFEKNLKRLVEGYVYGTIKIKESEFNMIKNSKYKNLLREKNYKPKFEKVLESLNKAEEDKPYKGKNKPFGYSHYFNVTTSRYMIQDLIDKLEEYFDLGIENTDPKKYNYVSLEDFKKFIKLYTIKNFKKHQSTINRIEDLCKYGSCVKNMMLELYSYLI